MIETCRIKNVVFFFQAILSLKFFKCFLFGSAAVPVFFTVIVPLTNMYTSLNLQKLDFNNEILNLI